MKDVELKLVVELMKNRMAAVQAQSGITADEEPATTLESGTFAVQTPDGATYHFSTQKDADNFKKEAGL